MTEVKKTKAAKEEQVKEIEKVEVEVVEAEPVHFKQYSKVISTGRASITGGEINGLDCIDKKWAIELSVAGKRCYVISNDLFHAFAKV